jgi:hypothetical protein
LRYGGTYKRSLAPRTKWPRYAAKLSRIQDHILYILMRWEYESLNWMVTHPNDPSLEGFKEYYDGGMDWQPTRIFASLEDRVRTPAFRADISRSLRRLEQRGLLTRFPREAEHPHYTYRVKLTPRGLTLAKRICGITPTTWEHFVNQPPPL